MQSYIYMSNMAKAVKRCGEIWLSMAREIFVEEGRAMKGLEKDGTPDTYKLMTPIIGESGELDYKNDLSRASFDVAVDVGPTSSSRRAATVRSVTGMLQLATDPETQAVLTSVAMMNMEGEGISDIRQYFRKKLVRMGVVEPNEAEQEEMAMEAQNQQPDPNAMFLQASAMEAEAKAVKAQADAVKAQADTEYRVAQTAETKASTLKTLAELENDEQRLALETAEKLTQTVDQAFEIAQEPVQQPVQQPFSVPQV
jgi:LysM repeat protein